MLPRHHLIAAMIASLMLAACSDDDSPTTAPMGGRPSRAGVPALATTSSHSQLKGLTARADFTTVDQSGCVETDVFAFGSEQTSKLDSAEVGARGKPLSGLIAFVTVSQFDFCTGQILRDVSGFTTEGSFQADRVKLSEARLEATMPGFDFLTQTEVAIEVDLIWSATGELVSLSSRFRQKQPGLLASFFFKGTQRDAAATGTVLVGAENFTPNVSNFAEIIRSREGSFSIVKSHGT